jgi:hypothetical protein
VSLRLWRSARGYIADRDPLAAAANLIAMVVACNQPFYPLYLYLFVSEDIGVSFLTFLSTPFFLAVPAVARRHSVAGRALLPLTGMANTVLSTKAFGEDSGVEVFLMPCIVIAAMLFRSAERAVALALIGLGLFLYAGLRGRYGVPLHLYSSQEYSRFLGVNAFSAGALAAFVGLTFSSFLADSERGGKG